MGMIGLTMAFLQRCGRSQSQRWWHLCNFVRVQETSEDLSRFIKVTINMMFSCAGGVTCSVVFENGRCSLKFIFTFKRVFVKVLISRVGLGFSTNNQSVAWRASAGPEVTGGNWFFHILCKKKIASLCKTRLGIRDYSKIISSKEQREGFTGHVFSRFYVLAFFSCFFLSVFSFSSSPASFWSFYIFLFISAAFSSLLLFSSFNEILRGYILSLKDNTHQLGLSSAIIVFPAVLFRHL